MNRIEENLALWLAEDVGRGDWTTNAVVSAQASGAALIQTREPAVVAGAGVARMVFKLASPQNAWEGVADGEQLDSGASIATVKGPVRALLTAERTALNLLSRLCGVATFTRSFVDQVRGTPARIVDTRKTTPGLRLLEKAAVVAGGGSNHRFGLDDGILIKDNHIVAAGSITTAVERARVAAPFGLLVEVEVQDIDGFDEALAAGAQAVLLDNMEPELVREAVGRGRGKLLLEASGGINLGNVRSYAETGVDIISIGALTHSAPSIDLTMELIS